MFATFADRDLFLTQQCNECCEALTRHPSAGWQIVFDSGQVFITLLSTSATWIQVDPLVVLQGNNQKDDESNLAEEDLLFDKSNSKN